MINIPIHESCHYSVRTHHKVTLQPKLRIVINLQDQYLSTISNVNLSPKQSPKIKILFKFDIASLGQTAFTGVGDRDFTNKLQD